MVENISFHMGGGGVGGAGSGPGEHTVYQGRNKPGGALRRCNPASHQVESGDGDAQSGSERKVCLNKERKGKRPDYRGSLRPLPTELRRKHNHTFNEDSNETFYA